MATIKRCDKCGTEDATPKTVIADGVHLDLCDDCHDEVFAGEWFAAARARIDVAPPVPARRRVPGRGARPPQHGFTAAAIEAAQDPGQLATRVEVPPPDPDPAVEEARAGKAHGVASRP